MLEKYDAPSAAAAGVLPLRGCLSSGLARVFSARRVIVSAPCNARAVAVKSATPTRSASSHSRMTRIISSAAVWAICSVVTRVAAALASAIFAGASASLSSRITSSCPRESSRAASESSTLSRIEPISTEGLRQFRTLCGIWFQWASVRAPCKTEGRAGGGETPVGRATSQPGLGGPAQRAPAPRVTNSLSPGGGVVGGET